MKTYRHHWRISHNVIHSWTLTGGKEVYAVIDWDNPGCFLVHVYPKHAPGVIPPPYVYHDFTPGMLRTLIRNLEVPQ